MSLANTRAVWAFRGVGALYLFATIVFGLLFPVMGVLIMVYELAPPGEDPAGPGMAGVIVGPCTALFYLPVAILAFVAAGRLARQETNAQGWAIACAVATMLTCAPFGALLLILTFLKKPS